MAGARNSLRVVRMLVEARSSLRKSERKLRQQQARVRARKGYRKVAKQQYTFACGDVLRSRNRVDRNRVDQIDAVERLEAIEQLNVQKRIQKFSEYHFASASSALKKSQNRLSVISAVKRANKFALDQLILELSSFPTITVSSKIEVSTLIDLKFRSAYTLSISGCPLGEIESVKQFCTDERFDLKEYI